MIWAHMELTSHCFERPPYNPIIHRTTTINHYLLEITLSIIEIVLSLSSVSFKVDIINAVKPVERPINQWSNQLPPTTVRPQCNLFERPSLGPLRAHQT